MTQASQLAVPAAWDLVAPAYTEEIVPKFELFAKEALRLAAPPASSRIIDVACGPGTLSVLAARAGHQVDAIDFSHPMIERAAARIAKLGISTIELRVADGQALPFADATFDAGFSMFGLMFFPDRAKGFAELRRVLRPGARAVVSSWTPMEQVPLLGTLFGAVREGVAKATGTPPGPSMPGSLSNIESCRDEMSRSFADVAVHEHGVPHDYASVDALWENAQRTAAPMVLMKKNLGDKFSIVDEVVRTTMRDKFGAGPVEMNMTAYLTVGTAR
jgi:ubiquinone/menaquinone biosynthesis C-methylase UbiE